MRGLFTEVLGGSRKRVGRRQMNRGPELSRSRTSEPPHLEIAHPLDEEEHQAAAVLSRTHDDMPGLPLRTQCPAHRKRTNTHGKPTRPSRSSSSPSPARPPYCPPLPFRPLSPS
ncbi:hypothetical protein FIBSPDRAFT_872881 [Athelia psychrophila]|uniref:Uncharacterized protein n=1 Tax=Athelia psychrophila TaxID=1759441 RepID=A0A165Z487_9AGAM|nr:hypothetical protein FIBSPDRAFT_872881 [Fibularhizoctonia sp. CBS 109695]